MKCFTWIILVLSLIYNNALQGQDTIPQPNKTNLFPKSYGEKKWSAIVGLDARRSFFAGTKIKINGLKLGAEYNGVHRFGVGFYWLSRNVVFTNVLIEKEDQDVINPELRFSLGYSSIFYERVFFKTRWWDISFPLHLGGGNITGTYKDTIGAFQQFTSEPFSALLPSAQVKFYPLTWMALRVSLGYRIVFNTQVEVKKTFRTIYYGYGLSINPLELYRVIFNKERKSTKNSTKDQNEENSDQNERR